MGKRSTGRKRPCRVCRRWFSPDPRPGERQKTCGRAECRREWHRRQCEQWNRKNTNYYQENYLQQKLERTATERDTGPSAPEKAPRAGRDPGGGVAPVGGDRGWPRPGGFSIPGFGVVDLRLVVVMEYVAHLAVRRAQKRLEVRRT